MNSEKFGLDEKTLEKLKTLFQKNPKITKVLVYGSRALGTHRANSDIDMTLVGDELQHSDLLSALTQIEALMLPYKVDLSVFKQIDNPSLIDHIKRVGQEL